MELSNKEKLKVVSQAKSDQLNADDIMTGTKVIKITGVKITISPQQPVTIFYEGDQGKPWKPSKGMYRLLQLVINEDPDLWIGALVELYRNSEVKYAGEKVGGIWVCGASSISSQQTYMVTMARGSRVKCTVNPIVMSTQAQPQQQAPSPAKVAAQQLKNSALNGSAALEQSWALTPVDLRPQLQEWYEQQCITAQQVDAKNNAGFTPVETPQYVQEAAQEQQKTVTNADDILKDF